MLSSMADSAVSSHLPIFLLIFPYSPLLPIFLLIFPYSSSSSHVPPHLPIFLLIFPYSSSSSHIPAQQSINCLHFAMKLRDLYRLYFIYLIEFS
jgi:hypothetical protein